MIKPSDKTAFKFSKFKVAEFSFKETGKEHSGYSLQFDPTGIYNQSTGQYDVIINFKAFDNSDKSVEIINIKAVAVFNFEEPGDVSEIPQHFYPNSIAVAFPYVRAFISTLTMQANANILMLGLINFTNMAEPLKQNTKVIQ